MDAVGLLLDQIAQTRPRNRTELRKLKQELDQTRQVMQETPSGLVQSFSGVTSVTQPNVSENPATDSSLSALAPPPTADKPSARAKRTKAVKSTKKFRSTKKHGRSKRHERT